MRNGKNEKVERIVSMKKRIILAGVIAVSLAMSGCNKVKDEAKSKVKGTGSVVAEEKETKTGTDETETSKEPSELVKKMDQDMYSLYSDAAYTCHSSFVCYLYALTSWGTDITFNCRENTFEGNYESAVLKIDGDGYDMLKCHFTGTIDGFTRINEYSFSTHVTKLTTEKFDKKVDRYMDLPADVTYSDPYGFTKADEVILYLPNTPVSQIPGKALEWIEAYQDIDRNGLLGSYIFYNPAEETAFMVLEQPAIPECADLKDADLANWDGEYVDNHEGVKITFDKSSSTPTATIIRGTSTYSGMHIKAVQGGQGGLILYGTNDEGQYLVAGLGTGDQGITLTVYESNDPNIQAGKIFTPSKA